MSTCFSIGSPGSPDKFDCISLTFHVYDESWNIDNAPETIKYGLVTSFIKLYEIPKSYFEREKGVVERIKQMTVYLNGQYVIIQICYPRLIYDNMMKIRVEDKLYNCDLVAASIGLRFITIDEINNFIQRAVNYKDE